MIYILEDDDSIRKLVTYALQSQGYEAEGFAVPSAFREAMEKEIPSLLLLDIMLPEEDGISILKKLRADPRTARLPVIMLTARSTEYDHVEGLDAGADDYVAKPFGMMELLARVRALLRRFEAGSASGFGKDGRAESGTDSVEAGDSTENGPASASMTRDENSDEKAADGLASGSRDGEDSPALIKNDVLAFDRLRIYPRRYEVFVDQTEVPLTNKEYQLLLLLVENEGIVLTREILLDRIWDLGSEPENRTLDVHIRKLRAKLGDAGAGIETVRGVGYRFRAGRS